MKVLARMAAAVGFIALLAYNADGQGSLTPPGTPAETMKTLEQVEPRIDLATMSGDGSCDIAGVNEVGTIQTSMPPTAARGTTSTASNRGGDNMKIQALAAMAFLTSITCMAATTIDPANKHAYGANIGWLNTAGDVANGAVIGQAFCSGYIYGANVGWIKLGDGSPDNGIAYGNDSASDYGINHDGLGNLSGYAYGANIGWISFEQTYGQPKVNLMTGNLSGYIWSANAGWISLSNAFAHVRTQTLASGPDIDDDTLPDAWEYAHTNVLTVLSNGGKDSDFDGVSDVDEYGADTDPLNVGDYLVITEFLAEETINWVTWPVKPTRLYTLQHAGALSNGTSWTMTSSSFIPSAGTDVTEEVPGVADTQRFYRVQVQPPLSP